MSCSLRDWRGQRMQGRGGVGCIEDLAPSDQTPCVYELDINAKPDTIFKKLGNNPR